MDQILKPLLTESSNRFMIKIKIKQIINYNSNNNYKIQMIIYSIEITIKNLFEIMNFNNTFNNKKIIKG